MKGVPRVERFPEYPVDKKFALRQPDRSDRLAIHDGRPGEREEAVPVRLVGADDGILGQLSESGQNEADLRRRCPGESDPPGKLGPRNDDLVARDDGLELESLVFVVFGRAFLLRLRALLLRGGFQPFEEVEILLRLGQEADLVRIERGSRSPADNADALSRVVRGRGPGVSDGKGAGKPDSGPKKVEEGVQAADPLFLLPSLQGGGPGGGDGLVRFIRKTDMSLGIDEEGREGDRGPPLQKAEDRMMAERPPEGSRREIHGRRLLRPDPGEPPNPVIFLQFRIDGTDGQRRFRPERQIEDDFFHHTTSLIIVVCFTPARAGNTPNTHRIWL
ncbi:hypothetical protein [Leptospirillum ferriphilum]|uniref:hypothetical protein n=1 Tax=Leptospirillum ferriphilum TaxID=178606 RepID=UPI003CC7D736